MVSNHFQRFSLLLALTALITSFYFEYVIGLVPCPLCMMQRAMLMLVVLATALASASQWPKIWFGISLMATGGGLYFAGRQVYLQSLPADHLPACGPSLDALLHYFPWQALVHGLFWGTGNCGQIHWQWLGLSMAQWSLGIFCALSLLQLAAILCQQ